MSATRSICVLIGALGGQGGGVLTDWLVEAAREAGYPAQATSIPGVAQRTGATTYYFEIFPEREPSDPPVFCHYPDAGDLDLMVALEPMEAGRAMNRGFVTKDTVVVTSIDRLFGITERMQAGDGRADLGHVLDALNKVAKKVICVSGRSDGQLNAIVFGAIAGSGVLPITEEHCRAAIQATGVAVGSNLAGFEQGLGFAQSPAAVISERLVYDPPPAGFEREIDSFPEQLRPLVGHSVARLVDYHDCEYARRYLARLRRVVDADRTAGGEASGCRMSAIAAARLAAWMSYEDIPRVAQLKTRPGRLARIRSEVSARPGEPVDLIDYLKPSRDEFLDIVPRGLTWLVPAIGRLERGFSIHLRTSSPWGYGMFRLLAKLRRLRPMTARFAREQEAIDTWLAAVVAAAGKDYDLACMAAELAIWSRGYGKVRERGLAEIESALQDWPRRLQRDPGALKAELERSLYVARHDPDAACKPG
jgi:indolepyruvate ferredoxin oxidoreductase, beta subunit